MATTTGNNISTRTEINICHGYCKLAVSQLILTVLLRLIALSLAISAVRGELQSGGDSLLSRLWGLILTFALLGAVIFSSTTAIAKREMVDKEGTLASSAAMTGAMESETIKKHINFTFILNRLA